MFQCSSYTFRDLQVIRDLKAHVLCVHVLYELFENLLILHTLYYMHIVNIYMACMEYMGYVEFHITSYGAQVNIGVPY